MTVKQLLTADELLEVPESSGVIYELVRGELVEVPGATGLHGLIVALVYELIRDFVRRHDLGVVLTDGTAYVIRHEPDTVQVPDSSYVSWERVPEDGVPDEYWPVAPDLAVEVVSSKDRAEDVHATVHEYIEAGTRMVWVLWPRLRSVTVHEPGATRELGPDDELGGGGVLPGFRMRVSELFAVRTRRQG